MRRAIAGTFGFMVLLGITIFGAAGTLAFWQGWCYYAAFSAGTLGVTIYFAKNDPALIERRMQLAEPELTQRIIRGIALSLFLGVLVVPGLDHRHAWSAVPPWLAASCDVLVLVAYAGIGRVFAENTFASSTIRVEAGQHVISSGPYAHVRHPMYTFGVAMILATSPGLGSWIALPFAVALVFAIGLRAVDEEKRLLAGLPGYADYIATVRYRLLPGVW